MISRILRPFDSDISKRIITLAYPIIFANISRAIMGIVDMIMVGKLGVNSIAAVGFGEMIVFSIIASIGISLMTSTQTITARRYGEKRYPGCNEALINGQAIGIAFAIPLLIIGFLFCENFIKFFIDDSKTVDECVKYTSIQFLGILFPICGFIFRGFFTGIQKTSIYLKVVIFSNIINAYLNLGFIFGKDSIVYYFSNIKIPIINKFGALWTIFPFPRLEIEGAAIATVFASIFAFLCFLLYYFSKEINKRFYLTKLRLNPNVIKKQIYLAWPVLKREGSIMLGFTYFLAIMGRIGTIELAISNIAFRIYNVSIMPAFGVGAACGSIVGFYLGEGKSEKSWIAIKDSFRFSLLIMGSLALFFIIFPKAIISIFIADINFINIGIPLIRFLGVFSFLDAIAVVLMCSLDGAGDVNFTAKTSLIFVWLINIPLIYLTGIYFDFGLWGPWLSWMVGFIYLLAMMIQRIIKGDWKNIKV